MIDEKRLETTPVQHVRNLMESVSDGKITIGDEDPLELFSRRTFKVSCGVADTDEAISKYEALVQALEMIGVVHEKIKNGAKAEEILTPEQLEVWNTYIREFDDEFDSGEYDLDIIYDMSKCGAPLSDEEQSLLERHYEWLETQSLKRLPKRAYSPMNLIIRAKRYEYLISHKAPKSVIDEEGRCLAEEMILYSYCV